MNNKPRLRFKDKNGNAYPKWENIKIGEKLKICRGASPRPIDAFITTSKDGINWIKIGDVSPNTNIINNVKEKITAEGAKKSRFVKKGDLILSNSMSFGRPYILNVDGCIHDGWLLIKDPYETFNKQYLCYLLDTTNVKNQYKKLAAGGVVINLNSELVRSVKVAVPNIEEQEKITGFLSKVDELINECESEVKDLEEQKKGLMQKIFSQQIRFKDANNNPYSDWKEKKLGDVSDIQRGGSPRPIENYLTDDINGINWIKIGDVSKDSNVINATKEKIKPEGKNKSRFVTKGDLLLSNSMSFGRPYILNVDGCIHDGWLVIRNYKKAFNTNFLCYILDSDLAKSQYKKLAAGGVVINLNKELVASTKFFVPCLEEQEKIAKVLSKMDELIEEKKALLSDWQQFKKGLLQQMFV